MSTKSSIGQPPQLNQVDPARPGLAEGRWQAQESLNYSVILNQMPVVDVVVVVVVIVAVLQI